MRGFTTKRAEYQMCVRTHLVEASAGRKTVRGFTLMEIIVVVALFSILTTLGLFMSMETLRGTLSRSEGSVIVSLLQKARVRAALISKE